MTETQKQPTRRFSKITIRDSSLVQAGANRGLAHAAFAATKGLRKIRTRDKKARRAVPRPGTNHNCRFRKYSALPRRVKHSFFLRRARALPGCPFASQIITPRKIRVWARVLQLPEQGRGKEAVSVRLVPQVPVRNERANGWFGGAAWLPAASHWPEMDGVPLQLLAQVDCAALPAELWDGLGPRHGWLTIFIEPIEFKVQVMHLAEAGQLTPGPALRQRSAKHAAPPAARTICRW